MGLGLAGAGLVGLGPGRPGAGGLRLPAAVLAAPRPSSPRPDPGAAPEVPSGVARARSAVVGLRARIPPDRPSAATLGVARAGSGALIDPDGTVLTVGYLVLDADAVEAVLTHGPRRAARVVGHDFESGLAVVRLDGGGPYPAVALGRAASLAPGDPVTTLGMTGEGRVRAVAARVTAARPFVAYWEYLLERALLVAPPHPDFGGAALVDREGLLVGIVSLRLEQANLAIPIDLFPPVREALLTRGRPARPPRPWLGVRAVELEGAVVIAGVSPAGPAHAAGLRPGDIVVRLEGERVTGLEDFYRKLWRTEVGREVELTIVREGRLEGVRVRPQDRHAIFRDRSP